MLQKVFKLSFLKDLPFMFLLFLLIAPYAVVGLPMYIWWSLFPPPELIKNDEDIQEIFGDLKKLNLLKLMFGYAQHRGPLFHLEFRRRGLPLIIAKAISGFIVWPGLIWSAVAAGISFSDEWDDVYGLREWYVGIALWGILLVAVYFLLVCL